MAIKNNCNYYRISFERSYVNNFINVYYDIYKDEEDRLKEKQRYDDFISFIQCLKNKRQQIMNEIDQFKITSESEWDLLYATQPEFVELVDMEEAIEYVVANYIDLFYNKNNMHVNYMLPSFMIALGGRQEWIDDPITYTVGGVTNCGTYNGEPITYDLYYTALKRIIIGEIIDLL